MKISYFYLILNILGCSLNAASRVDIGLDGDMETHFPLGRIVLSNKQIIPVYLEHEMKVDHWFAPYSSWRLSALDSYLLEVDGDQYVWKGLGMEELQVSLGDQYVNGVGKIEVYEPPTSSDGLLGVRYDKILFLYKDGCLVQSINSISGTIDYESLGVRVVNAHSEKLGLLLDVDFDGRVLRIESFLIGLVLEFRYENGLLHEVRQSQRKEEKSSLFIEYEDSLVSSIRNKMGEPKRVIWARNRFFSEALWGNMFPVHLEAVGEFRFRYSISRRGVFLSKKNLNTNKTVLKFYDPLSGVIVLK